MMLPTSRVYGFDISYSQSGSIKWDEVKARFVIIRASEGRSIPDVCFHKFVSEANRVHIDTAAYHFQHVLDPVDPQLQLFLKQVDKMNLTMNLKRYFLDCEDHADGDPTTIINHINEFQNKCKDATGVFMPLYSYGSFFEHLSQSGNIWIPPYDVWYSLPTHADPPPLPKGWEGKKDWVIHQYAGGWRGYIGSMPGVRGAVDLDYYRGSYDDFKTWCGNDVALPTQELVQAEPGEAVLVNEMADMAEKRTT